jgi:SAM-dependent methyltransferase
VPPAERTATSTGRPASCPACDGELRFWRWVGASEPDLAARRFGLWRCEACGTAVTVGALPPRLHETGAYRPGAPRLYRLARPFLHSFDRQRLAFVRALIPPPARLLDAGAGRGRFVLAAQAAGYEASGIEPSVRGSSAAAGLGAAVLPASIEAAPIEPGSVDAVTLWHVLEHLDHPGDALTAIGSWLRPAGGLVVGVPNLASLQARLGGARWYHLDVPRHRVHFTVAGLHALLERSGFEVVATHHLILEHNPFGMWQSWISRITRHPSYLYNLLKRNAPVRSLDLGLTVALLPLAPVAAVLELAAAAAGRGGTVAVLARWRR